MYQWWVFLHLIGVFGFLITHGVSVAVSFRLRKERDRSTIAALLKLSSGTLTYLYVFFLVLLGGGIVAGFVGRWWAQKWIWVSLILLFAIAGSMYPLATKYYRNLAALVGTRESGAPMASDEELDAVLNSSRPLVTAVIGFGGLLLILGLMVFKPF